MVFKYGEWYDNEDCLFPEDFNELIDDVNYKYKTKIIIDEVVLPNNFEYNKKEKCLNKKCQACKEDTTSILNKAKITKY